MFDPLEPFKRDIERIQTAFTARGTPSADEGKRIARQLGAGISYNGIQWDPRGGFGGYTFTDDKVTGSTFLAKNLGQAQRSLREMRERFGYHD